LPPSDTFSAPRLERLPPEERQVLLGLAEDELASRTKAVIAEAGEARYRVDQLRRWVYERTPADFEEMKDLPKRLRQALDGRFVLHPLGFSTAQRSTDGTQKLLWTRRHANQVRAASAGADAPDRGHLESVMIPDGDRVTYCISTQSGCPVKCTFCATGYGGFAGNLSAAEIVDQVLQMRTRTERPPTNLVYMGMGEPLLNYDNVAKSLQILTDPKQIHFGARRITVSTVGVPDRIRRLAKDFPQAKLALSLHAPNDDLRSELIPLNRKHPIDEVLAAVREHSERTKKNATFEYVVLPNVNDSAEDARAVGALVRGIPSRINLIPFNPFDEAPYRKPRLPNVLRFREILQTSYDGPVTVRRSRGDDIQGACGQLSLANR